MIRRLFNFAAALSLLLCVGAVVLWVRSGFIGDEVRCARPLWIAAVASENRNASLTWVVANPNDPFRFDRSPIRYHSVQLVADDPARPWNWRAVGFRYESFATSILHQRTLIIPFWAVALCWLILPSTWLIHRTQTRPRSGCCKSCGYDLRASPIRCPECGTPITATS
ncbi:MAG TPA: hypothetical protein VGI81_00490 [Tepidisphaeraceae bacterium]